MPTQVFQPGAPHVIQAVGAPPAAKPTVIIRSGPSQIVVDGGVSSAEVFGPATTAQTASAAVATLGNADAAMQRRMTRESYILCYLCAGAVVGQAADGGRGSLVGGAIAGAFAFYRSRPLRE
jgi:hypothetical protein